MSDLKLPYTGDKLLELLGNIKTEEELKAFIKQYSSGGGHTDEEIRIIVAEWYQANKDTQLTKEDVDGWIDEYLAEHPVSGGLTEQQVNTIVEKYIQDNNISGGVSAEEIAQAVENYIAEHPITGVTTEDIQNAVNSYLAEHPVEVVNDALDFDGYSCDKTLNGTVDENVVGQEYLGGYIEIQPDSWDGEACAVDSSTKKWGFPYSLKQTERTRAKYDVLSGNSTGIMYIRFPLGFAYRGYRNIDKETGLAKNVGERYAGQNKSLKTLLKNISESGGGLAPEYWCPAPHWVTSDSYSGDNQLKAGGSYPHSATLASIKSSDSTQYNSQIDALTDAIVDDLEYLHQNIAPVRMFGLQNEPTYSKQKYGACKYDAQTYNDVLEVLYPKILESSVLSEYNDEANEVKLHVGSSDESSPFAGIAKTFIDNHADWIWGYSHHSMKKASGEDTNYTGADWYKSSNYSATVKGSKENVFLNEYEYFTTTFGTDEFRCSNNMLRMIFELVYGDAKVLHPVIHLFKPLGQTLSTTNTKGYCLFETNLNGEYGVSEIDEVNTNGLAKGTYTKNPTMYNSWELFNKNLPVGAYRVGSYVNASDNIGYVVYKFSRKLYIFMANNSNSNAKITLTFDSSKKLRGLYYDVNCTEQEIKSKTGANISFVIPAYSGQFWTDDDNDYELYDDEAEEEPDVTTYTITNNLSNVTNSNSDTTALENSSYSASLTANDGYGLESINITMGGTDITSSVYTDGVITISAVTGNIVITATASVVSDDKATYTVTNNLTNATNSNSAINIKEGETYSATITPSSGYDLNSISVTMGENDITTEAISGSVITISNVTANIVITVTTTKKDEGELTTDTVVGLSEFNSVSLNSDYYEVGKAWSSSSDEMTDNQMRSAFIPKIVLDNGDYSINKVSKVIQGSSNGFGIMIRIFNSDGTLSSSVQANKTGTQDITSTFNISSGQYMRMFLWNTQDSTLTNEINKSTVDKFESITLTKTS